MEKGTERDRQTEIKRKKVREQETETEKEGGKEREVKYIHQKYSVQQASCTSLQVVPDKVTN